MKKDNNQNFTSIRHETNQHIVPLIYFFKQVKQDVKQSSKFGIVEKLFKQKQHKEGIYKH